MMAKILAGVLAAVSVAGVGVYVALPSPVGHCDRSCPLSGKPISGPVVVGSEGCNSLLTASGLPSDRSAPAVDADAMAACTGGMAVSVKPAKCLVGCCGE